MVKPTLVPERVGSSGDLNILSDDAADVVTARGQVMEMFRNILTELFQNCISQIPGSHPAYTVQVLEIPASSPGVPNFGGLTIEMHEPIVYLTTREAEQNPAHPADRRPSLVMLKALQDGRYQEFPTSNLRVWRDDIINDTRVIEGKATTISDLAPMVSEAFSNQRMQYDADNWIEIEGKSLAKIAFHEIAHCKAECQNRASSSHWSAAISGSIHDQSGVTVCSGHVDWGAQQSQADRQLMGRHMMCPLPFYKLGMDIAPQCFHNGHLTPPTPV